ncbi:MAG: glycosyltransferase family 2 protein [Lachnospiraceae bacterium]|nr:glycosyltransferase family 2 protein [Lachnospiraceae bacterium]
MITISVCMIVKNEEKTLKRCLESLVSFADEIIIVDTGSVDKTREIASLYTEKIYDFQWVDDFSKARNYSFSKATKEYIYVADADELIDEENQKKIQQLKQVLLPEIDVVQMMYCNQMEHNTTYNFDKEYRPKLYKRLREFQWVDCIHESVRLDPIIYDSDIEIIHKPEGNHGSRDFSLFQKMIARGEKVSKKLHNMYARELYIAGEEQDFSQAKEFFIGTVNDNTRTIEEIKEASLILGRIYHNENDIVSFFQYIIKDIVTEASSEGCYELGTFFKEQEKYEEACNWFINAIDASNAVLSIKYQCEFPRRQLLECYELLEQRAKKENKPELAKQYIEARKNLQNEIR